MTFPKMTTSPSKLENRVWATVAITLGVWETTAVTTKRIPTITRTCQIARRKHGYKAEATVIAWLLGLGLHLLKQETEQ